jgi:hypothetical protein
LGKPLRGWVDRSSPPFGASFEARPTILLGVLAVYFAPLNCTRWYLRQVFYILACDCVSFLLVFPSSLPTNSQGASGGPGPGQVQNFVSSG